MSLTFRIDGIEEEQGFDLPCPACGRSILDATTGPEHVPCAACDGYGGPAELPQPQFELHVHGGNAAALFALLQLDATAPGVDPADLLVKLTLAACPPEHERHFAKLSQIATKARRYNRAVVWS